MIHEVFAMYCMIAIASQTFGLKKLIEHKIMENKMDTYTN